MRTLRIPFPFALAVRIAVVSILVCLTFAPNLVRAQDEPTPLVTAAVGARPDRCEPNDRRDRACELALDAVAGPFTVLSAGDQDWYWVDLGAPAGLETVVTIRPSGTLDLVTSISRDDGTPITSFNSPAISTTLGADVSGPVIIRVETRASGHPTDSTYRIELRSVLPPLPPSGPSASSARTPDALENNWSPETAAPIAVDVVYDLNFVCPVLHGCEGGDHDYLTLPVKAGMRYLIATFDLGPGVDTVIDLFWGSQEYPLLSNDDARPGGGFLSVLRWIAPADGVAILRVGPRNGAIDFALADPNADSYRLAVALAQSDLAGQLEERIAQQTHVPTGTPVSSGTPVPTQVAPVAGSAGGAAPGSAPGAPPSNPAGPGAAAAPAAAPAPAPQGDALKGAAMVLHETMLRTRPDVRGEVIQTLPPETLVSLLGTYQGLWVQVQTADAVIPGWLRATDLKRVSDGEEQISPEQPASAAPSATTTALQALPTPTAAALRVALIEPLPLAVAAAVPVRLSRSVSVRVISAVPERPRITAHHVTPVPPRVLGGVRVQLVNAFGDVLAEAVTTTTGMVTLTREVDEDSALFLRLPAIGIEVPASQPELELAVPTEREP